MTEFCVIEGGITKLKALKYKEISAKVSGGKVLDLGCGNTALYWALGYIERADEVMLVDFNSEFTQELEDTLSNMSPDFIEENYSEAVLFFKQNKLLSDDLDYEDIASLFLEKISLIETKDFTKEKLENLFDYICFFESLGCVNTKKELLNACCNAFDMLNKGGSVLGLSDKYIEKDERVKSLIKAGFEGELNPSSEDFKEAFEKAGFKSVYVWQEPLCNIKNYLCANVFEAKKDG